MGTHHRPLIIRRRFQPRGAFGPGAKTVTPPRRRCRGRQFVTSPGDRSGALQPTMWAVCLLRQRAPATRGVHTTIRVLAGLLSR